MESLGALYHWSPKARRESIRVRGLIPAEDSTVCRGTRLPYLCFGPTPSAAWGLSGDMEWLGDVDDWDLWQVRLQEGDDIRIRNDFGPRVVEVKVHNPIPADRIWWVGERTPWLTTHTTGE